MKTRKRSAPLTPLSAQARPQRGHCQTCRRQILTARYDALPLHLDPQPLSQLGEFHALAHGLKTWWIFDSFIYKRHADAINSSPTGLGGIIHRQHDCTQPQPTEALVHFRQSNYDREEPDF